MKLTKSQLAKVIFMDSTKNTKFKEKIIKVALVEGNNS